MQFRKGLLPEYRKAFARLALGQKPDALFIACSDSRVAVNVFASTDPGDLFVVRNIGNMVPPLEDIGGETEDSSVAALEFALNNLSVPSIVICGHSECGAMEAIAGGRKNVKTPNLRNWLRFGDLAWQRCQAKGSELAPHNHLSQENVLLQVEHLKSYPQVRERIAAKKLQIHALWFELSQADVYIYDQDLKKFVLIDEEHVAKILTPGPSGRTEMLSL